VATEKPNVIFLAETKNQEAIILKMQRLLKFSNYQVCDPIGLAGGLAMLWNEDIIIHIERATKHFFFIQPIQRFEWGLLYV